MMYLTRILLDPASRGVQRELAFPYEMHRTVMRAFPDLPRAELGRVLFRVDFPRSADFPVLYVQSLKRPDWTFLGEWNGYLARPSDGKENPAVREFSPVLKKGQCLRFRLRANPTVKREGKRYGILRAEDQVAWLIRKSRQGGFQVSENCVLVREERLMLSGKLKRNGDTHVLKHLAVVFEGHLVVTDLERFRETLANGIGSAKGMGFGLLSIAPG